MIKDLPDSTRSIGDLVGASFRLFRTNFRFFMNTLWYPTALGSLSGVGFQWCIEEFKQYASAGSAPLIFAVGTVSFIISLVSLWIVSLRMVATLVTIVQPKVSYAKAIDYVKRRQFSSFFLYMLGLFGPMIGILISLTFSVILLLLTHTVLKNPLVSIAVFIAALGSLTLMIVLSPYIFLYISTVTCLFSLREDQLLWQYFDRAVGLIKGSWFKGAAFFFIQGLAVSILASAIAFPIGFASGLSKAFGSPHSVHMPIWLYVLLVLLSFLSGLLVRAIKILGMGLFFNDWLMRTQGADLERRLLIASDAESQENASTV